MTSESLNAPHLHDFHALNEVLVRERETFGRFLHDLSDELANQQCEFDADEDSEFAYFDIKVDWDLDDIDICVHDGHVVVRMVRE